MSMTAEQVIVSRQHPTEFRFDAIIEGINPTNTRLRFVIKSKPESTVSESDETYPKLDPTADMSFECTNIKDTEWSVKFPPFSNIKQHSFPFIVEAIVDGYFVEALSGTVQVQDAIKFDISSKSGTVLEEPKVVEASDRKHAVQAAKDRILDRQKKVATEQKTIKPTVPKPNTTKTVAPKSTTATNKPMVSKPSPKLSDRIDLKTGSAVKEAEIMNFINKLGKESPDKLDETLKRELERGELEKVKAIMEKNKKIEKTLKTTKDIPSNAQIAKNATVAESKTPSPQAWVDFINNLKP